MNRIDTSRRLTVGEVSQRSGLPVSTIHFYESKGLIQSAAGKVFYSGDADAASDSSPTPFKLIMT